jgi:hypothetical protein
MSGPYINRGPWAQHSDDHCISCGSIVDQNCSCPRGVQKRNSVAIMRSVRECIRVADKPRARLIPAFSCRAAMIGQTDYPTRDTWMIHKSFNGRVVHW